METAKAAGVDPAEVNFVSYDGGGDLLTALLAKKITIGALVSANSWTRSGRASCACSGCRAASGWRTLTSPRFRGGINLAFTN